MQEEEPHRRIQKHDIPARRNTGKERPAHAQNIFSWQEKSHLFHIPHFKNIPYSRHTASSSPPHVICPERPGHWRKSTGKYHTPVFPRNEASAEARHPSTAASGQAATDNSGNRRKLRRGCNFHPGKPLHTGRIPVVQSTLSNDWGHPRHRPCTRLLPFPGTNVITAVNHGNGTVLPEVIPGKNPAEPALEPVFQTGYFVPFPR